LRPRLLVWWLLKTVKCQSLN